MAGENNFTEEEGKYLLSLARETIEQRLLDQNDQEPSEEEISAKFHDRRGTFVTLTTGGNLRGCIGHIIPQESVIQGIRTNAINAAFRDLRFPPLTKEEWQRVKIEVSILTDPKPLSYSDAEDLLKKLRSRVDGVIINPGAFTHYCYALYDALLAIEKPIVEVHLSNIFKREEWRHKSVVSPACLGIISGFGSDGYFMALRELLKKLRE